MVGDIQDTKWVVPWHPIADGRPNDPTAEELYKEVGARHPLFGIKARPIGHRQDCDDFLFELLDGSGRFAVVHLTYSLHPEPDPRWPETTLYGHWADFLNSMHADSLEWND